MSEWISARVGLDLGSSSRAASPFREPPVREQRLRKEPKVPSASGTSSWLSRNLPMACLVVSGAVIGILLAVFIVLFVNFPDGYNDAYGLSFESISLFRAFWAYPTIHLSARGFPILAAADILTLWAVYLAVSVVAPKIVGDRLLRRAALYVAASGVLFYATIALFMPPVLSSDIYHYILFGRMVAVYGLNPYVVPGTAISGDPFWHLAFWRDVTTHYGPVWTILSAGLAMTGGQNVLGTVMAFKGFTALMSCVSCGLVYCLVRDLSGSDRDGFRALVLYAWNPLILIESAGSGHNEVVMMTFALFGLLMFVRGRMVLGTLGLVCSVLVTYLTLVLALFIGIQLMVSAPSRRAAMMRAIRLGGVAVFAVAVLFVPFWDGLATFSRLLSVGSPFKSVVRLIFRAAVMRLLGSGSSTDAGRAMAEQIVVVGVHAVFAVLVVIMAGTLLWMGIRQGPPAQTWGRVLDRWNVSSLVYLTCVYGWNLPWFLMVPMATTFVTPNSRTTNRVSAACAGLGIALMLRYCLTYRVR
jgi:hypothetical protein